MRRAFVVLRPEPGNAATVARIRAQGASAIPLPLFAVTPVAWTPPDPAAFDALLLTSANAARHAGAGLNALPHLPVIAVGAATATAARGAGLDVALAGTEDAAAVIAEAEHAGFTRLLHLSGRDSVTIPGGAVAARITVYASDPRPLDAEAVSSLVGQVALLHSARAALRLRSLLGDEAAASARIAAISAAAAQAAGPGWDAVAIAARPTDASLIAAACTLAD